MVFGHLPPQPDARRPAHPGLLRTLRHTTPRLRAGCARGPAAGPSDRRADGYGPCGPLPSRLTRLPPVSAARPCSSRARNRSTPSGSARRNDQPSPTRHALADEVDPGLRRARVLEPCQPRDASNGRLIAGDDDRLLQPIRIDRRCSRGPSDRAPAAGLGTTACRRIGRRIAEIDPGQRKRRRRRAERRIELGRDAGRCSASIQQNPVDVGPGDECSRRVAELGPSPRPDTPPADDAGRPGQLIAGEDFGFKPNLRRANEPRQPSLGVPGAVEPSLRASGTTPGPARTEARQRSAAGRQDPLRRT